MVWTQRLDLRTGTVGDRKRIVREHAEHLHLAQLPGSGSRIDGVGQELKPSAADLGDDPTGHCAVIHADEMEFNLVEIDESFRAPPINGKRQSSSSLIPAGGG